MHDALPRVLAAAFLSAAFATQPAFAQATGGLNHVEDASAPPAGAFRLRVPVLWTRFDARFATSGVRPLGGAFAAESLGVANFPELGAIQSGIAAVTGSPFSLTLGRSRLDALARQEVLPLAVEYGVTTRWSVGVMVPIIRKRVATLFRMDTTGSVPNVGPNPNRTLPTATTNNDQVQAEFANAASQLQSRLTSCQQNPAAAGCSTLLARQAEATQLLQESQTFAADVLTLYGGSSNAGMAFVPRAATGAQADVGLRVADFNTRYQDLLTTTATLIQAVPSGALVPPGPENVESYLLNDLGRDSINTQERLLTGDIELGFKFRALDRPPTETRRLGTQLALASSVRFPTGSRQQRSDIVDMRSGDGAVIVDSRAILDLRTGRFGLLTLGRLAMSVRDIDSTRSGPDKRWIDVDVAPRWHLSQPLSLHAAYSLRSADSTGSDQLLGGGITFSGSTGTRSAPIEMRFTHLEAITGAAGRPKFFRDQIEFRIYYRLRR